MKSIERESKIKLLILAAAFFQIAIMLNSIPAESYFIGESFEIQNAIGIKDNGENFSNILFGFLVSFFSIKQIGFVSATPTSGLRCCKVATSGAICQDVGATEDCTTGNLYATT